MTRKLDAKELDDLCTITQICWAAAGQGLRRSLAAERLASEKLAALARSRQSNLALLAQTDTADAASFRFLSAWLRWSEKERKRLNQDLARHRATLAAEQAKARKAFGRREVARKLRDQV